MDKIPEIKREYVFSTYVENIIDQNKDALIVKEIIHEEGKEPKRGLRIVENYVRPYWITKKEYQDHKDKKEFEFIEKLNQYSCIQRKLAGDIFYRLNGFYSNRETRLVEVSNSPYLYGSDITSNDLLKQDYVNQWGKIFTPSTVAVMDYEWDMNNPKEEILAGIISMKETVHIALLKSWVGKDINTMEAKVREACNKYRKKYLIERNIKLKITFADTPAKLVISLFKTAHQLKPDFLVFWNIEADMGKIISALKEENIDPAYVFSDPSIPNEYKYFHFHKDSPFKIKANGDRMSKSPSERWHTIYTPASFYLICAMSTFRVIRAREQQRSSYGLDSILNDYLQIGKMHFDSLSETITGRLWHQLMQKDHKVEYIVYLFGDGVDVEALDEKTKDISETIRPQSDTASFDKFKSNPRRLATDFHFAMLDEGKVVGSTSKAMLTDLDKYVPSTKGWIVTLPAELEDGIGLPVVKEFPFMPTNVTVHAFDIDLTSGYPSSGELGNVSKYTTMFILCSIEGLSTYKQREFGINLTSVISNPLSLAKTAFGYPNLDTWEEEFKKEIMCI